MKSDVSPIRSLECCCCGNRTRGRQWFNRDTGYGLCVACVEYCKRGISDDEFRSYYGERGVHFDVPADGVSAGEA